MRLIIGFLFVGPRFRYCFLSLTPRDMNLASRYRVRWQLRPLGLPPKLRDMPVIQTNPAVESTAGLVCLYLFEKIRRSPVRFRHS